MSEREINPNEVPRGFTRREFCKFSVAIVAALGVNQPLFGLANDDRGRDGPWDAGEDPDPEKLLSDYLEEMADHFNSDPSELKGTQGWINALIGFKTSDKSNIQKALRIEKGRLEVLDEIPLDADAIVVFLTKDVLKQSFTGSDDDICMLQLKSFIRVERNLALYGYFGYLVSILTYDDVKQKAEQQIKENQEEAEKEAEGVGSEGRTVRQDRIAARLKAEAVDPGVMWLPEPYLSQYTLDNFDRLKQFLNDRQAVKGRGEVTCEQPELITDFYIENGFETQKSGEPWEPVLRTASAFNYLMRRKKPILRENDLLAGTYTPNPISGTITQPYTIGWSIWSELKTVPIRVLDRYEITEETRNTLHKKVFPFWARRNIRAMWKSEYEDKPFLAQLPAQLYDRLFCLNLWGPISLNPGCPGFEKAVRVGLLGIVTEIEGELRERTASDDLKKKSTLKAMLTGIDGVLAYANNLAREVEQQAKIEQDPQRRQELLKLFRVLRRVPKHPAGTLHEAIQSLWIMHIALGLESMDDDLAIGRLDQILQPYFNADMERLETEEEREHYIKDAIELVGCLFMRINSHWIAAPTIASWQNSGAPPTTSTVVGGVTPKGADAVCDMTYIVLKVVEMLALDDPDMEARYMPGVNSDVYLKRICEVNALTWGTPGMFNDKTVIEAWSPYPEYDIEDLRDYVPCGCVEPVIAGKHFAATGDGDFTLMVPLIMAMNNGDYPDAHWPELKEWTTRTGLLEDFKTFDEFYAAFETQFKFIAEQVVLGSKQLLKIQRKLMPAPIYSALLEGCIESGKGMTEGGAKYNTSGASLIALADVIDSLTAINRFVFEGNSYPFTFLKEAMDNSFQNPEYRKLWHEIRIGPMFGSGEVDPAEMANRVTKMVADYFHPKDNGRGGYYTTGFRSNANHVVYGRVAGATPSGRLANQPFTPGLTPDPEASPDNIMGNMIDIANLDSKTLDNCYSFNVRLNFKPEAGFQKNVDEMFHLMKAYFDDLGGMQVQFIVADRDTLIDARANPEYYPNLICRVSGYTGYYTTMQKDLQEEILNRCQYIPEYHDIGV